MARPGSVLVDRGAYEALSGRDSTHGDEVGEHADANDADSAYSFRRLRRVSVKGYSRLEAWALRPPS